MKKTSVFIGVIWASVQRFGTMIISFVSNIVLARLLLPSDFGTVGMLLFFITIANTFVDSGLGSALIQKKKPSQRDYSTVFFSNLIISTILYVILFVSSPFIAQFYNLSILSEILRIEGIILLLNSFCIIPTTILRKRLDFKKLSIANIGGNVIGTVLGIGLAYCGYGLWSLVIRMLAVSFFTALFLWNLNKWRPSFVFSITSFKELFNFGGFVLLSSIVTSISNNVQTLIIGRMFVPKVLGVYTQAQQLRDIPSMSISSVISQVLYPVFSNHQDDNTTISEKMNYSVYITAYVTSAILAILIIIAKPLILILYSEKWIATIDMFQILCVGGLFLALQDINYYVIASKGKSRVLFIFNFLQVAVGIALKVLGGMFWGIKGLLWAMVITSFLFYIVYAILACYYSKSFFYIQLRNIFYCIILALFSGYTTNVICENFDLGNLGSVTVYTLFFVCIYLFFSYLLKIQPFMFLISILQRGR